MYNRIYHKSSVSKDLYEVYIMNLTERDKKLFLCLRQNARLTLTQISRKTKIPISTLFDMLKQQQQKLGIQHTTLVDFSKLGFDARVQLLLRANKTSKDQLKMYLSNHNNINTVMKITNGYDFIAEGIFQRNVDVDAFIENLQNMYSVETCDVFYISKDIKRERALYDAM